MIIAGTVGHCTNIIVQMSTEALELIVIDLLKKFFTHFREV